MAVGFPNRTWSMDIIACVRILWKLTRLRALSDLKAKLKTEMCKSHRLGSAKTDTGCYNYWKDLRPLVNKQATNAFWNNNNLKFNEMRNNEVPH